MNEVSGGRWLMETKVGRKGAKRKRGSWWCRSQKWVGRHDGQILNYQKWGRSRVCRRVFPVPRKVGIFPIRTWVFSCKRNTRIVFRDSWQAQAMPNEFDHEPYYQFVNLELADVLMGAIWPYSDLSRSSCVAVYYWRAASQFWLKRFSYLRNTGAITRPLLMLSSFLILPCCCM